MTLKGIKFEIFPDDKQESSIQTTLRCNHSLFNMLLGLQRDRHTNGGTYLSEYSMNYIVTALKKEYVWLKEAESTSLLYTSANVDDAFDRFFKKQNDFPKFKSRHKSPVRSFKMKCVNDNIEIVSNHYIKLPKLGKVRANGLKRVKGTIKSVVIRQLTSGGYECTALVETVIKYTKRNQEVVGIDLGIEHLSNHSDGFKLPNKNFERTLHQKKVVWEKKLARRRQLALEKIKANPELELELSDFKNYVKAKQMVAKYNRKIANQRNDYLQKYTTELVKNHDVIVLEDLKVKNMQKNHHLARSIADQSWARIKSMIEYKCEWYGKLMVLVDPRFTSKTCHSCGERTFPKTGKKQKDLAIRQWTCSNCGQHHDRDVNAALVILQRGLDKLKTYDSELLKGLEQSLVKWETSAQRQMTVGV
jgi:putative transposase